MLYDSKVAPSSCVPSIVISKIEDSVENIVELL